MEAEKERGTKDEEEMKEEKEKKWAKLAPELSSECAYLMMTEGSKHVAYN
jgi:hypothetical protein